MLYGFADPEHIKRERAKAKTLRDSQWWRQQIGNGICYHCGQRFSKELLTMDHLVPVARGGKSTKGNCVVACKDCNSKKGHKLGVELTMEEMAAKGELSGEEHDESGESGGDSDDNSGDENGSGD
jgi:5-methylcytosine-specific restriction protein A